MAQDLKRKKAMYSDEEKELLRELVLQQKDILENRKNNFVSLTEKKKAWEFISEEFNSFGGPHTRTTDQLKKLWENIKFRRKAKLAAEEQEVIRIEGGQPVYKHGSKANYEKNDTSINGKKKRCAKDDVACEANLRVKRAQLQLDAEATIHKLRIEEQQLKLEYIQRKNEQIKTEEQFLEEKRKLEILILNKQLQQLE